MNNLAGSTLFISYVTGTGSGLYVVLWFSNNSVLTPTYRGTSASHMRVLDLILVMPSSETHTGMKWSDTTLQVNPLLTYTTITE